MNQIHTFHFGETKSTNQTQFQKTAEKRNYFQN